MSPSARALTPVSGVQNVIASGGLLTQPFGIVIASWTVLGTATENLTGHYQFLDGQAGNFPQRFYILRSP